MTVKHIDLVTLTFTDAEWWEHYGVEFFRPDEPAIDCVREAIREIASRRTPAQGDE